MLRSLGMVAFLVFALTVLFVPRFGLPSVAIVVLVVGLFTFRGLLNPVAVLPGIVFGLIAAFVFTSTWGPL